MNRFLLAQVDPLGPQLRFKSFSAGGQLAQLEVFEIICPPLLSSRACVCTFNYLNAYFWSSEFQDS